MNKKKIFDYAINTPHNTNPNVLSSLLNEPISWNDLTDKPFYEETTTVAGDTLTWDGNTEGLVTVDMGAATAYLVHEPAPSVADMADGAVCVILDDLGNEFEMETSGEEIQMYAPILGAIPMGACVTVFNDGATIPDDEYTYHFPKAGIYIVVPKPNSGVLMEQFVSLTIPGYTGFTTTTTVIKPIDTKYLPEHLQFGETVVKGDTLTWDGDTDGLVSVGNEGMTFYLVSESVPTMDDLKDGMSFFFEMKNGEMDVMELSYEDIQASIDEMGMLGSEVAYLIPQDNFDPGGLVFPKAGWWFFYPGGLTIPGYGGFESKTVTPMDEKYMPILTSPSGKKFKLSVDDSGAVTATEVT